MFETGLPDVNKSSTDLLVADFAGKRSFDHPRMAVSGGGSPTPRLREAVDGGSGTSPNTHPEILEMRNYRGDHDRSPMLKRVRV